MTLTEQEAKTKRCQETFSKSPSMCLGSACMAWRWFDNLDDEAIKTPRGYCGKAGQP